MAKDRYDKRLWREISIVLFRDWDPIGVSDMGAPSDEYDSYIGGVYRLVTGGAEPIELARHLLRIETETLGLETRGEEAWRVEVADKLLVLRA
ncbi:MAG: hypothetical protein IID36_08005 [Planctomycetes bacterium]|nr:hypothetical protein [Planctomycetota bacterium]